MKTVARVFLYLYVPIVAFAVLVGFLDPTWEVHRYGTGYEGMLSVIAAIIVGLPWSLLFMGLDQWLGFTELFGRQEDTAGVLICWSLAGLNIWLLSRWAFPTTHAPRASSDIWLWVFDVVLGLAVVGAYVLVGPVAAGVLGTISFAYWAMRYR